jgi:hypothetical protein
MDGSPGMGLAIHLDKVCRRPKGHRARFKYYRVEIFMKAMILAFSILFLNTPAWALIFPAQKVATLQNGDVLKVSETVFRGPFLETEGDYAQLKALGITTLLSLQGLPGHVNFEREMAKKYGFNFISNPIQGSIFAPSEKSVNGALSVLANSKLGKIYVHCKLGRDRTGLVIALYRVFSEGVSANQAYQEMRAFGFRRRPWLYGIYHYLKTHTNLNESAEDGDNQ